MKVTTVPVPVPAPDVVITLSADEALLLRRCITSQPVSDMVTNVYRLSTPSNPKPWMSKSEASRVLHVLGHALKATEQR